MLETAVDVPDWMAPIMPEDFLLGGAVLSRLAPRRPPAKPRRFTGPLPLDGRV
jgi:hypothetical protein